MIQNDFQILINKYQETCNPDDRYTSFDYCYNYFSETKDLTEDMEKSCLTLGFYLASWGMFRGSSFLLNKSSRHFIPTINFINGLDRKIWEIDIDNYTDENIQLLIETYHGLKEKLILNGNTSLTLITKIMLGVFGNVPAFDSYFCDTFRTIYKTERCGFRRFNEKSLSCLRHFYEKQKDKIDVISKKETFTTDFNSGNKTHIHYPKAKIVDMYGFIYQQKDDLSNNYKGN